MGEPWGERMKRYARTWFAQFKGLMFDNSPDAELEFEFSRPTRFGASVNTCFMRYPVLVQWLDSDRKVMEERVMRPWIINHTPKEAAKYIIEKRIKEES